MASKILVVDDDVNICEAIKLYLEKEFYEVVVAHDGVKGIEAFKSSAPDLILLDIMMTEKDGWQVCREIRAVSNVPIIMLTAKGEVFDKVLGLELGADDFMTKPFDMKELAARIKTVLRRCSAKAAANGDDTLRFDKLEISKTRYQLKIDGKIVDTPPKELELLFYLASNPNQVFTRDQLLDKVWGFDYYGDTRTVDVHIKRLREKLEGVSESWALKTVWSVGYKFETFA